MKHFSYSHYDRCHKDEVINLLPNVWRKSIAEAKSLFEWKYEQNPFTNQPFCFVALCQGKVVGFRGYLVHEFIFGDKVGRVAALADTITHPDYRRMGMFEALTKYSLEEMVKYEDIECTYNLSASWPPTGGYLKLGWQPIAPRLNLYYFNFFHLVWSLLIKKKESVDIYTKVQEKKVLVKISNCNLKVEISSKIVAKSVSLLAEKATNLDHVFKNRKTEKYYQWRYMNPSSKFIFSYLWRGEELVSFVAFNAVGVNNLVVVDFLTLSDYYLKTVIKNSQKHLKIVASSVWTISQSANNMKVFRRCGYIDFNFILQKIKRFKHPPALVRPNKSEIDTNSWIVEGYDLRDEQNWTIFKIDSDAG